MYSCLILTLLIDFTLSKAIVLRLAIPFLVRNGPAAWPRFSLVLSGLTLVGVALLMFHTRCDTLL
jgi:hypothetical protein